MAKSHSDHASEPIDVSEVLSEEIPAELLERVSEHHPCLVEVNLQVRRNGWKIVKAGRRVFTTTPPSVSVIDLCTFLVVTARQDAEKEMTDTARYRVRLVCKTGEHTYTRYASVRGFIDEEGALQIVDDDNGASDESAMKFLQSSADRSANIAFACLEKVMGCVKGFAEIAETFNKVLGAAGTQWSTQVNSQVEMLKLQMEMEQNSHQHNERMKKWDKGFAILEGPVGRIGDEIVEFAVEGMRAKRQKQRRDRQKARASGNGSAATHTEAPTKCEHAETLDDIFGELSEQKIAAVREIMTPDEWKLIEVARRATTSAAFDAAFNRFYALLKQRGDKGTTDWIVQIAPLIGQDAMTEIGLLIKRIERPEEAASAS